MIKIKLFELAFEGICAGEKCVKPKIKLIIRFSGKADILFPFVNLKTLVTCSRWGSPYINAMFGKFYAQNDAYSISGDLPYEYLTI